MMFENLQVYAGNIILENSAEEAENFGELGFEEPQTPQEIIEFAKQEANEIIHSAREEATQERDAILNDAAEQVEREVSENVARSLLALRTDLLSSKVAMGEILTNALDTIVGNIGHDRMMLSALEKAITEYTEAQSVCVFANRKTLERLHLVAIASKIDLKELGLHFQLDAGLEDKRCVLSNGDTRIEVGLDAQIEALKKVLLDDSMSNQKAVQSKLAII